MNTSPIRQAVLRTARASGMMSRAAASAARARKLPILCYHGIALRDEDQWLPHLFISRAKFKSRLGLLRSFDAAVLPLGEAVDRLRKNALPPRSVVITFDDGYVDFHVHARPLLREFGFPATLYLSTYYCLHRRPVFNLMANYLLWKSGEPSVELAEFGFESKMPNRDYISRQAVVAGLLRYAECAGMNTEAKDGLLSAVAEKLGIDYAPVLASRILQLMKPEEVADIAQPDIGIELHTHRHRTPRDRGQFVREIRDNAHFIREFSGRQPVHFCYPSGDYDLNFLPWLRELGVATATTCLPGLVTGRTEPLLMPRFLDDSVASDLDFERWISGFWLK